MVDGLPLKKKMTTSCPELAKTSLFTQNFSTLNDPRRITKANFQYPLEAILFLNISAIICGFTKWKEIVCFSEEKID